MGYQTVFKRYELKFLLTQQQKKVILETMKPWMEIDRYGRTTIRNLYFDTENYRLIRHSVEKPVYKEKLRIRSYQKADPDSEVFVELKRNTIPWSINAAWLCQKRKLWPGLLVRRTAK